MSYSLVEGGLKGPGIVRVTDADPRFVAPGRWDDAGTPEDDSDDAWVEGDYRLQPGSPCIDAAHAEEARGTDIEGNPRSDDRPYEFPGRPGSPSGGCAAERSTRTSLVAALCLLFVAAFGCSRSSRRAFAQRGGPSPDEAASGDRAPARGPAWAREGGGRIAAPS